MVPAPLLDQSTSIIQYSTRATKDTVTLTYTTPSLQIDGCFSNLPLAMFVLSSINKTLKTNVSLIIMVLKNMMWKSMFKETDTYATILWTSLQRIRVRE